MTANVQIVEDYSEKAIAVIGETKAIKEQLKELGGRFNPRLTCGAGWIFSKKMIDRVKSLINGEAIENIAQVEKTSEKWLETLKEYASSCKDEAYTLKSNLGAIKIDDKYILFSKHTLKTRFCFHDEGVGYEHYKDVHSTEQSLANYFMFENTNSIQHKIELIKKGMEVYISYGYYDWTKLCSYYVCSSEHQVKNSDKDVKATPEQVKEILSLLEYKLDTIKKRCSTYLKRYGVSKLHTWTYWADR